MKFTGSAPASRHDIADARRPKVYANPALRKSGKDCWGSYWVAEERGRVVSIEITGNDYLIATYPLGVRCYFYIEEGVSSIF